MISENLQDLNYEYIILNEPIKNSAVQYNYFYKLLYSTHIVSLTSIFLLFELNNLSFENDKIKFDRSTLNNSVFSKLIELEDHILNLIIDSKNKLYKLKEIYENQFFKFSLSDDNENINSYNYLKHLNNRTFIIKISGIWESKDSIGLTFKFIKVNKFVEFI
jgi:hypothetical protein|uniref:Uncharacterized protein n=1 Tax=viral metagenome TaxID=1070528 RepID=A0A6C0KRH1_9ZZZZ